MLNYLKGVKREFKNIKWPTTKTTIYYTIGVIVISTIIAIFIWLSDMTFIDLVNKFLINK